MDIWKVFWASIAAARIMAAQAREQHMAALAPQLPPAGLRTGKTVIPRARAHLPAGIRKRIDQEEV
ncbi:hypothetical protein [Desulfoscipio geothermicus]|uniref:Uncharacterized protein n=1 Tax=Desulfoscipio geothermicus DSM 3669 TaxID=1121426 RepID=A0A1I6ECU3_9FIRM|nr:hypothetical protein [Desulfoscipio geothermicus]SFR15318.1 hypothetical protein SAMN05660706_13522 [Desulfoscipio geothermicus DSM 3669]